MKQRIITAIVLLSIIIPIVVMPNTNRFFFIVFQVVLGILVLVASHEMIRMYETKKKFSIPAKLITMTLTFLMYLNFGNYWNFSDTGALPVLNLKINQVVMLVFSIAALLTVFVFDSKFTAEDIGKSIFIIFYVGLGTAAIAVLKTLGVRFIVYVILISTFTDMFAYFFGIAFGKHKMAPHISPKKSWEGAIGGTVMATIVASSFAIFYGDIFTSTGILGEIFNPGDYLKTIFDSFSSLGEHRYDVIRPIIIIFITFIGSVAAQIGDLVASKMKRSYEIKDFGTIFPGHGGVLDRFDSILFISFIFVGIFLTIQAIFPLVPVM